MITYSRLGYLNITTEWLGASDITDSCYINGTNLKKERKNGNNPIFVYECILIKCKKKMSIVQTGTEIITTTGSKLWHYGYKYVKSKRSRLQYFSILEKRKKKTCIITAKKKLYLTT